MSETRLASLAALAVVIHTLEGMIPMPFPWMRLGLANVVTLIVLSLSGLGSALMVTVVRVVVGSLIAGQLLGPGFFLALAGGTAATVGMGLLHRVAGGGLSLVGVSLAGAFLHNAAQLAVAGLVYTRHAGVFYLLPVLMGLALPTGLVTGWLAERVVRRLKDDGESVNG